MNTGIISSRYAKALLLFSQENGDAEQTFRQARTIEKAFSKIPEFHQVIDDIGAVPDSTKLKLLRSALGKEEMTQSLERFFNLVVKNGRTPFIRLMLHTFIDDYYKWKNILFAKLITTKESPELEEKLNQIVKEKKGKDVIIETEVNPDLIGGFIFILDDLRIDTTVVRQLDTLKRELVKRNRRIV